MMLNVGMLNSRDVGSHAWSMVWSWWNCSVEKMTVAHDWYDNDTMIFVEGLVYNR